MCKKADSGVVLFVKVLPTLSKSNPNLFIMKESNSLRQKYLRDHMSQNACIVLVFFPAIQSMCFLVPVGAHLELGSAA